MEHSYTFSFIPLYYDMIYFWSTNTFSSSNATKEIIHSFSWCLSWLIFLAIANSKPTRQILFYATEVVNCSRRLRKMQPNFAFMVHYKCVAEEWLSESPRKMDYKSLPEKTVLHSNEGLNIYLHCIMSLNRFSRYV